MIPGSQSRPTGGPGHDWLPHALVFVPVLVVVDVAHQPEDAVHGADFLLLGVIQGADDFGESFYLYLRELSGQIAGGSGDLLEFVLALVRRDGFPYHDAALADLIANRGGLFGAVIENGADGLLLVLVQIQSVGNVVEPGGSGRVPRRRVHIAVAIFFTALALCQDQAGA